MSEHRLNETENKKSNRFGVILLTEYHASSIRLSASSIASQ